MCRTQHLVQCDRWRYDRSCSDADQQAALQLCDRDPGASLAASGERQVVRVSCCAGSKRTIRERLLVVRATLVWIRSVMWSARCRWPTSPSRFRDCRRGAWHFRGVLWAACCSWFRGFSTPGWDEQGWHDCCGYRVDRTDQHDDRYHPFRLKISAICWARFSFGSQH
jgi:hypothetical protein